MTRPATPARLPRLLTVRAVAEATTMPPSSIYDAIYAGELTAHRFGRAVRVEESEVATWITRHREAAP